MRLESYAARVKENQERERSLAKQPKVISEYCDTARHCLVQVFEAPPEMPRYRSMPMGWMED